MSLARLLRSAASFALFAALAAAAWLGFSHLAADGLGTFEALAVGAVTLVVVTLVAFSRG